MMNDTQLNDSLEPNDRTIARANARGLSDEELEAVSAALGSRIDMSSSITAGCGDLGGVDFDC